MAWAPIDPQRAVELFSMIPSFLSEALRKRLLAALAVWPAVSSPDWQEAVRTATQGERRAFRVMFTPTSTAGWPTPPPPSWHRRSAWCGGTS